MSFVVVYDPSPRELTAGIDEIFNSGRMVVWTHDQLRKPEAFFKANTPEGYVPIVAETADEARAVFKSYWLAAFDLWPDMISGPAFDDFTGSAIVYKSLTDIRAQLLAE